MRNSVERKIYMKTKKIVPGARFMADINITESPQLLLSINTVESFVWVGHQSGWKHGTSVRNWRGYYMPCFYIGRKLGAQVKHACSFEASLWGGCSLMALKDVIRNSLSTSTALVSGVRVLYRCLLEGNGLGIRYTIKAIVCFILFSLTKELISVGK